VDALERREMREDLLAIKAATARPHLAERGMEQLGGARRVGAQAVPEQRLLPCRDLLEVGRARGVGHQSGLLDGGRAPRDRLLRGLVEEAEEVVGRLRGRRGGGDRSRAGAGATVTDTAVAAAAAVAGADVRILLLRERGGGGVRATIRGLVHRVAGMPLDPFELDAAPGERAIDVLEQIDVQHGLAVLLAPALA